MSAPPEIISLTRRFGLNLQDYKSGQYNETQLRHEYLDPFFEVLGWDVNNKQGFAEAYKDVIHEDSIKVGGLTKAPDYCFRIGGTRKFFVEAKKPSVNIKDDINPAFQLRRYAWSARLPLSILTDFEEFAVYDCRVKPDKADKPSTARTLFIPFQEYEKRWDEIASIFSLESIRKGSFDRYAESEKKKKGTAEVDAAFLKEIESWRELLARNIALRNPALSQRELNFAVQQTIDRIIFLRICEDRGIEEYNKLYSVLNGVNVYPRLCQLFRRADDKYNSGLFHFTREKEREEPDELTLNLAIDDNPLKEIIKSLYYPDSPYEFSVLPADILGQVYEQFLGKVIRLTDGHRAVVEDKPEVKKAGGVYYTPTYIVDYIVKNTVGQLLGNAPLSPPLPREELKGGSKSPAKQLNPKEASKLRILDPACGSGSFLIGAFQYLLDWHRDWYVGNDPQKWAKAKSPVLFQAHGGEWRLTTTEKKRILLNNIYGVDIDPQAVEVTKLSLLLKVLEGESEESLNAQLRMFHERALPDLGNNIKCGNSLIGPDFYNSPLEKGRHRGVEQQLFSFEDEERFRINVFDWEKEFLEIFNPWQSKSKRSPSPSKGEGRGEGAGAGGFDAVIGNPPYSYLISSKEQSYFSEHYDFQDYQKDLYLLFLERYKNLLRGYGLLGVIISNTWLQSVTYQKIRKYLVSHYNWIKILHCSENVFGAVVDTHVIIFKRAKYLNTDSNLFDVEILKNGKINFSHKLDMQDIPNDGDPINIIANNSKRKLFFKIKQNSVPLMQLFRVYNGVKPFEKGKGKPPQTEKTMKEKPFVIEGNCPGKGWKPLLRGSLIQRYVNLWRQDYWISYGEWLAAPRDPMIFETPLKIMVRQTGDSVIATLVEKDVIGRDNLHIILPLAESYDLRYLLGILNSKTTDLIYAFINPEKGEALAQVKKQHVENLPIRPITFSNNADKSSHDKMVKLVEQMLTLNKQLASSKTAHEKTILQRQLDATDKQIDSLVYELYWLTEEEIGIVEGR